MDPQYRGAYDESIAAVQATEQKGLGSDSVGTGVDAWGKTAREVYFASEGVKRGGANGLWDPVLRTRELDRDGVAAEMVFSGPQQGTGAVGTPFTGRGTPYELRMAGARAYHRWLAELCSYQPERHAGVVVCPMDDIHGAVEEITGARKAGLFGGLGFPQPAPPSTDIESLWCHPRYEPIWSLCEELDIPIQCHQAITGIQFGAYPGARWIASIEGHFVARRGLWQLLFSGAFERHPGLKLCITEVGGADFPYWISTFDHFYESKKGSELRKSLPRKPSEYWYRQCFLGASPFSGRLEMELRDRIGVRNIMWGSDYPHKEGAWPFTRERMQALFAGLPEEEISLMVGGNAARVCSFDLEKLRPIADRIGPKVSEFKGAGTSAGADWGRLWTEPAAAAARGN